RWPRSAATSRKAAGSPRRCRPPPSANGGPCTPRGHERARSGSAMKSGFYTIMAAQFFSSLADNALLIAAIAMLAQLDGPAWLTPLLKFFFTISYVVLAFLVGAFADSMPKGRVMFITNAVKIVGCLLILFNDFLRLGDMPAYWMVLIAYAVVGL